MTDTRGERSEWDDCIVVPSVPYSEDVFAFAREELRTRVSPAPTEAVLDEYMADLANNYTAEMPLREYLGFAMLEETAIRFRLMARDSAEAGYAAKLHFGEVPTSIWCPELRRPR